MKLSLYLGYCLYVLTRFFKRNVKGRKWVLLQFQLFCKKSLNDLMFERFSLKIKNFAKMANFKTKKFVKGPALRWRILWNVLFWDEKFFEVPLKESISYLKNCPKNYTCTIHNLREKYKNRLWRHSLYNEKTSYWAHQQQYSHIF